MKNLLFLHLDRVVVQTTTHPATAPLMMVAGTGESLWDKVSQTSTTLPLHLIPKEGLLSMNLSDMVLHFQSEALLHQHTVHQRPHGRVKAEVPWKLHTHPVLVGVATSSNSKHLQDGNRARCLPVGCSIQITEVIIQVIMEAISMDSSVTIVHNRVAQGLCHLVETPIMMKCSASILGHTRVTKGNHHKGTLPRVVRYHLRIMVCNSKILNGSRQAMVDNIKI